MVLPMRLGNELGRATYEVRGRRHGGTRPRGCEPDRAGPMPCTRRCWLRNLSARHRWSGRLNGRAENKGRPRRLGWSRCAIWSTRCWLVGFCKSPVVVGPPIVCRLEASLGICREVGARRLCLSHGRSGSGYRRGCCWCARHGRSLMCHGLSCCGRASLDARHRRSLGYQGTGLGHNCVLGCGRRHGRVASCGRGCGRQSLWHGLSRGCPAG